MVELRRHVERIVRPIRASGMRKMRMREELLTHLTQLFAEETAAHPGDAQAALATACERFGDATALRAELQETVPAIERVMCAPLPAPQKNRFARRPGERASDYVRRTAILATAINAVTWMLFVAALAVLPVRRAPEGKPGGAILIIVAYVLSFPLLVYGPLLLCEQAALAWSAMRSESGRGALRWAGRAAGFVLAAVAIYSSSTFLYLMLFQRAITIPIVSEFWFWGIGLSAALVGLPIAVLQVIQLLRWEQWEGLVLDEPAGTAAGQ